MNTRIVSFSELFKFDTCKRQYYYGFELGLKPTEMSGPIDTGIKGHRLLQDFYLCLQQGKTKEEALAEVQKRGLMILQENKFADMNLVKAWTLVDNYIKETDFISEAVLVENRFLFPFAELDSDPSYSDVQIGFTPDVVFKRKGDFYTVEDAKFVGRAWSKGKLSRFQQAKLYQILLKRMGYNVTRSAIRFFNTTTSKVTDNSFPLSSEEEAILTRDFVASIKELVDYRERKEEKSFARRTTNYTACQFCYYNFLCTIEGQGKNASKIIETEFEKTSYDYRS